MVLYRDDGTTLYTQSTSMDLKTGAAAGSQPVHAEGPFGTLDAQGFALVDKGDRDPVHRPGQAGAERRPRNDRARRPAPLPRLLLLPLLPALPARAQQLDLSQGRPGRR